MSKSKIKITRALLRIVQKSINKNLNLKEIVSNYDLNYSFVKVIAKKLIGISSYLENFHWMRETQKSASTILSAPLSGIIDLKNDITLCQIQDSLGF